MINLKDKTCDLFKMYNYLVLTENWLLYNPEVKDNPLLNEMWGLCLRNCSCQINITDTRSYASKVCTSTLLSFLLLLGSAKIGGLRNGSKTSLGQWVEPICRHSLFNSINNECVKYDNKNYFSTLIM